MVLSQTQKRYKERQDNKRSLSSVQNGKFSLLIHQESTSLVSQDGFQKPSSSFNNHVPPYGFTTANLELFDAQKKYINKLENLLISKNIDFEKLETFGKEIQMSSFHGSKIIDDQQSQKDSFYNDDDVLVDSDEEMVQSSNNITPLKLPNNFRDIQSANSLSSQVKLNQDQSPSKKLIQSPSKQL